MCNFESMEHLDDEIILNQNLKTTEVSLSTFILEVDLEYPEEIHDSHQDYPLAPTKETVILDWLSPNQTNLLWQMRNQETSRCSINRTEKLL